MLACEADACLSKAVWPTAVLHTQGRVRGFGHFCRWYHSRKQQVEGGGVVQHGRGAGVVVAGQLVPGGSHLQQQGGHGGGQACTGEGHKRTTAAHHVSMSYTLLENGR